MNVLMLANHCNTGGITSYVLNLSRGLLRHDFRVTVVSGGGNCVDYFKYYGVLHKEMDIQVKSEVHPKLFKALPQLCDLIQDEHIDIIHAQTRVTQVLSYWASKRTKKPFVSTCHGFFKPRLFRKIFPCWGNGVIAISGSVRDHLVKDFHVKPQSIALIPNGIDASQYVTHNENERLRKLQEWRAVGGPHIGIIARLSSVKGIDVLIAAMPTVLERFPQAVLWIVGDGPMRTKLQEQVMHQKLAKSVRFLPIVNHPAMILPIFNVFVQPSIQEGLGLAVMEAQAASVPVVASAVGGLLDLVEDGQTGLLVPPGNSFLLGQRINEILSDPAMAKRMAQNAYKQVTEKFTLDQMVASTITFYEENLSR